MLYGYFFSIPLIFISESATVTTMFPLRPACPMLHHETYVEYHAIEELGDPTPSGRGHVGVKICF